MNYFH